MQYPPKFKLFRITTLLSCLLGLSQLNAATVGTAPWQGTAYSAFVGQSVPKNLLPNPNVNAGATSSLTQTFNATQTGQTDQFSVVGNADAQFGMLHAYSSATVTNGVNQSYVFGVYAGTFERFLIDAPGITGQQGTATFRLNLSGTNTFTRSSNLITGPAPGGGGSYVCANISASQSVLDLAPCSSGFRNTNGTYTAAIPFTFGTSFTVFMDILASVWFGNNSISGWNATFTADYSHTAVLDQILAYTGSTANPANQVSNFNVAGSSNTVYSTNGVVPEPATYALFGAGLAFVTMLGRRKRK